MIDEVLISRSEQQAARQYTSVSSISHAQGARAYSTLTLLLVWKREWRCSSYQLVMTGSWPVHGGKWSLTAGLPPLLSGKLHWQHDPRLKKWTLAA